MNKNEKNSKVFDSVFWVSIICFIVVIGIICFFPKWLTSPSSYVSYDFSDKGQIGDTISGTMGPFIAIAAAILTFIAFWVQYKANYQQTKQFHKQDLDVRLERFENKFYELLRIQRENLNEINIKDLTLGRKAFITMFFELRFCYYKVKSFIFDYKKEIGFKHSNEELILDIAYHIFFMGIGTNSDKLVFISLKDKCENDFLKELLTYLNKQVKDEFTNGRRNYPMKLTDGSEFIYKAKYMPLSGHISRLGHYFRHLYQTIGFIARQDNELIDENRKCEYVNTLRAQLSDYEQLILYYNICSSLGNSWIKKGYIKRFRMIKNMPVPLADFGIDPYTKFKDDILFWKEKNKTFFEWDGR